VRRQLTNCSIEEFKNLLSKVSWNEVFNQSDVNSSLKAFLDIFLYCFDIAFPYKRVKLRERINKTWLSKGLIVSSKRMQILNNLKRTFTLTREALIYIEKYQRIYNRVLKEAKKKRERERERERERNNDRYGIESMDKTKTMWQLINRETGEAPENDHKLEWKIGNKPSQSLLRLLKK
jgi:hypothetical protein